ncbi:uncharacterized protein MELLADRAFT_77916 [Melampsora larici-populina 98AG31]|uniref:Uncharacterized protein n=1 Tax=Melampsora larici-populina (strain 98AG31 / pathotype 3-4-7) TaxID=747676 RepID=F4RND3_MELLP|nr:uncharacterized protein MELLADRAFT_77916 [Melampsora larici-populina 98AG31]EGG06118.1 hypothetical protein MELLADRAFT_77916 [Melampsora larici-populina 98AG31]
MSTSNTMPENSVPIHDLQVEGFQERLWTTPECLPTTKATGTSSDTARLLSRKEHLGEPSTRSLGPSSNTNSESISQVLKASTFRCGTLSPGTSHGPSSQVTHSNDQLKTSTKASNIDGFSCAPLSTRLDTNTNPELLSLLLFGQSDLAPVQPSVTSCSFGGSKQDSTLGLSQADIDSIVQFAEGDFQGSGAGVISSQAAPPLALPVGFSGIQTQNNLNDFTGSEGQIPETFSSSYPQQPIAKRPLMSNQSTSISSDTFDPGTALNSINVPEIARNPDDAMDMQTFLSEFIDPKFLSELLQRRDLPGHESSSSIAQPTSTSSEQRQHPLNSPTLSYATPGQINNPDKSLLEHQNATRINFGELGDPAVSLTKALDERAFFSHCIPLNDDQLSTSNLLGIFNGSETQKSGANLSSIPQPLSSMVSLTSSGSASHADWDQLVPSDLINSAAQDSSHWIDDQAMWSRSPNTNDNISSLDALNTFDQAYQGPLQNHGQFVDWGPVRS